MSRGIKCKNGLTVRRFIQYEDGTAVEWEDLTPEQQEEQRRKNTERLGKAFSRMYSRDPELYRRHLERGIIRDKTEVNGNG